MSETTPQKSQGIVAELEAKLTELRSEVEGFAKRVGIDVEHVWATVKAHISFP